jgi:glutamate carboxypeptidase
MGDPSASRVLAWLTAQESAMCDLLAQLARAESPSGAPGAQREAFGLLGEAFAALGYTVRRVHGRGAGDHLLACPRERLRGGPFQLLVGHLDTVWPLGTLERMPVRALDGRLYGPGVFDMKGGLVQMVFALRVLAVLELTATVTPVVFVVSDEEVGSPDSERHLLRLARAAARAFILEPGFGPSGKLKTERKGAGGFTLEVVGRASHAGVSPGEGVSAILELSYQIQRLFALNDPDRGVTVNVGAIDGGLRPNVVAPTASAKVDVRVRTEEDARRVEAAIRGLVPVQVDASLRVTGTFGRPPMARTARNHALWLAAKRVGGELGLSLDEARVGGVSDGNLTSLHTATLDGLGPVGDGAHAQHEHVEISRLPERAALLALLLLAPVELAEPADAVAQAAV